MPRPLQSPYCVGDVQTPPVQIGKGLPSAKLETVEAISSDVAIARTRRTLFIRLLLGKMDCTVLLCSSKAHRGHRSRLVFLFGKRNL